ncbi:hypothetical protein VOA_000523 [Vibrio sp. RC586]|uniref:porin n=1 Tax=Vibrio sp. RC586 TaxID=675815 RepID=UPI0001BB7DA4|nr:porin [Vibrio sp. RC586]EEZ00465.1 hypothetical protein VOA_000523 [Vibrio sp. RC586]
MKIKAVVTFLAVTAIAPTYAQLTEIRPDFYGSIQGLVSWEDNQDKQTRIQEAILGLQGFIPSEHVRVRYKLAAEYSDNNPNLKENNEIIISESNVLLMSQSFGALYIGNGTTGAWQDLYSKVDIFDSNNISRAGGNGTLFRQDKYGKNIVAYASPVFHNFSLKVAAMSPKAENGSDVDVLGLRALYNTSNFSLVFNRAEMDQKFMPSGYTRWALSSGYRFNDAYFGALVEYNEKDPQGDSWVYALSGQYQHHSVKYRLGVQAKQYDAHVMKEDETLLLANISYALHPNASLYGEVAEYFEDSSNDKISLGLIAHF